MKTNRLPKGRNWSQIRHDGDLRLSQSRDLITRCGVLAALKFEGSAGASKTFAGKPATFKRLTVPLQGVVPRVANAPE